MGGRGSRLNHLEREAMMRIVSQKGKVKWRSVLKKIKAEGKVDKG